MKLLHSIFQIGGPSLSHSYDATVYLIRTKEGPVLIDCGTPEGYEQIRENMIKLGEDPAKVRFILATHGHYDHVGAAHLWKKESGCSLYLHENDREQVEQGDSVKTSAALLYGRQSEPCRVDALLQDGDLLTLEDVKLEVLHTPGHTMGSVCFVAAEGGYRLLIAGDTIWGGFSARIGSDEEAWKKSLERITSKSYDFFTFGHVPPQLIADADARLKEAQSAFANYYNPWFKTFDGTYRY